ncbi:hypothetical protein POM88_007576 [Heracleum sosnowskyi]|uniref:Retinoblastoma-associated protein N-terminal domain-containing protein n=1 Tax=Heracleum sosnowskyi TaxID=360622 RepID=A0AAD8N7P7_9APIA|nr:hypothetical protein POM88_007576 [Heracleum sosnowskyi]
MASIILFFAPSKLLPSLERARCEFIVSIATKSDSVSDIEARFTDICKNGLSMDESTMTADMLFNQIKHLLQTNTPTIVGAGTPEEAEHHLFAFVLYSVRRLSCEFIVSIATKSDSVSDIEARFTDICKNGLSMDESTMTAYMLFNQIKHLLQTNTPTIVGAGTPEEAEHHLFAFVLYSVRRLSCEFIVSIATKSDSVSDIEARFTDICKNGLSMDESTMTADMLFNQIKHLLQTNTPTIVGAGTPEEAEHHLFAFVLYSVRRLSKSNSDNSNSETDEKGITLCQILRVAKLNLVDFFKEVPQFIVKVGPILCNLYGPNWENKLEANYELQANFVHMTLLSSCNI